MEKVRNGLSEPQLINKNIYYFFLYSNYTYIFNHNQLLNNELNTNKNSICTNINYQETSLERLV